MISIKLDTRDMARGFDAFARRQLPFASARTVTEVARAAAAAERQALPAVLDRPTPFTLRGPVAIPGTKARPVAIVAMRPIQAAYLAPEEFAEPQRVKRTAVLRAVDAPLNAYGNLPRGLVQRLRGRPDIFVGQVDGVGGIWQRLKGGRGRKPGLKLLIRFAPPVVPRVRLGFVDRAIAVAGQRLAPELARQLAAALRSAR